jgi:hypothetical protein
MPVKGNIMQNRRRWLLVGLITVLILAIPLAAYATHRFSDVRHSNVHNPGIGFVADAGVTLGCGGGKYCPSDAVRRDQMATFMHRLSGWEPNTGPVVAALDTVMQLGQMSVSGHEPFTLTGGTQSECKAAVPVGVHNRDVSVQHQLTRVPSGNPALVNVSLSVNRNNSNGAYQVCFARLDGGNLVPGTYDTNVTVTVDVFGPGMQAADAGDRSDRAETVRAALERKLSR